MLIIIFQQISEKNKKIEELDAARLSNVPVDTKKEIDDLNLRIVSYWFVDVQIK